MINKDTNIVDTQLRVLNGHLEAVVTAYRCAEGDFMYQMIRLFNEALIYSITG